MKQPKTFWDTFDSLYQHGPAKHRTYLLDKMDELGVSGFLDVGCGTGPLYELNRNRENPFMYKGVDYSWAMIEQAQKHFPEGSFEVQDARKLKESDSAWDAVVLMHCLDHLDDYRAAIREATRVSRKYVIIILWRPFTSTDNLNSVNTMHKDPGEDPWDDTHLHEYNKDDLAREFRENNLEVLRVYDRAIINEEGKYNWMVVLERKNEAK